MFIAFISNSDIKMKTKFITNVNLAKITQTASHIFDSRTMPFFSFKMSHIFMYINMKYLQFKISYL